MVKKSSTHGLLEQLLITIFRGLILLFLWPFRSLGWWNGRKHSRIDPVRVMTDWREVNRLIDKDDQASLKQAVIEADKIVDDVFKQSGFQGESFATRLRAAQNFIPSATYQMLWDAHKVRNSIVHQLGHAFTRVEAERTVRQYRAALTVLGVK